MASAVPASRYDVLLKLASGGMATVYIGQVRGALGFRQLVAIKRPHAHLLDDASFRAELVAEARLASMISHANVVDVRDVEITADSINLVMDYIEGASLGELLVAASRAGGVVPARAAVRIVLDACAGLNAAHELVDERGRPVGLVHRDVSPQNILVGTDGIARVVDFGVAKFARKNLPSTSGSTLKGKLAYMAPEYVRGESIDRRFDVFAAGVVLWEALTGRRLFRGANEVETLKRVVEHVAEPPSAIVPGLGPALDDVVATALAKNPEERFQNAAAMAAALERSALEAGLLGGASDVVAMLKSLVGPAIEERRALVRAKLAHEPSVASLMGVPPLVQEQVAAAVASAPAETVPAPTDPAVASSTLRDPTVRDAGAPVAPAASVSSPPIAAAPPEGTVASYTLMSAQEETAPAWAPPRRPAWVVPAVAFGVVLASTIGGGALALRSSAPAGARLTTATSAAPSASVAAVPPSSAVASAAPEPALSAVAAPSIASSAPVAKRPSPPAVTAKPVVTAHPVKAAAPPPSTAAKRFPDNPYE